LRAHLIERGKEEQNTGARARSVSEDKEPRRRSEIEIRDVDRKKYREKGRRRATCLPDYFSMGYVKLLENVGIPFG